MSAESSSSRPEASRSDNGVLDGYGAAIFEVARAEGQLDRLERELFTVAQTFATSNELRDTLTNPSLPLERKQGIIDDLIGGRASTLTVGLVAFVVEVGRAADLPTIIDAFIARAAGSRSKAVAEIRSAVPLETEVVQRLSAALSRATGKDLELKVIVDPTVLGGIVARVGDVVIDGSVAHSLASLREAMKSA
ncbi:MAG TPA: ATP synthase F1 subunit delta [Acidimicrobiia bacterium]|nr:ATP synthase F1 subunit delta [Acidimicrobiia bacterium]